VGASADMFFVITLLHLVMFEDFVPKNGSHVALHECNSGSESGRELFKAQKTRQVF